MSKKRDIRLFLMDIIEAIENIMEYTHGMDYEDFIKDKKTMDAVIRNLEIVGEAVKSMPEEIKKDYPEVDWKEIAGMRDKLIHEYFGVSYQIVWETIKGDLPAFEYQIERILEDIAQQKE
jgi:uncharacterized protein with HEPN domain